MDKRCERVCELVWSNTAGEDPDSPELVEARRHVAACPPCRAFLVRDGVLAARIRELKMCGATPCPESVRRSLEHAIGGDGGNGADGGERAAPAFAAAADRLAAEAPADGSVAAGRRWPAWTEGAIAAAAAIVLIAGGLLLSDRLEAGLPDDAFIDDYERTALPEIVRQDVPRQEVEAFYRTQFGGDAVPRLLDAPVTKVGVCDLEGRRGAVVEYDWSGNRVVYYQVPKPDGGGASDPRSGAAGELNVVRWADERYDYALIAALPSDTLKELADRVRT